MQSVLCLTLSFHFKSTQISPISPPLHCNCSSRTTTSSLPLDKSSRSILSLHLTQSLSSTYTADQSLSLKHILHLPAETKHSPGFFYLDWASSAGSWSLVFFSIYPKSLGELLWSHGFIYQDKDSQVPLSNLNLIYTNISTQVSCKRLKLSMIQSEFLISPLQNKWKKFVFSIKCFINIL